MFYSSPWNPFELVVVAALRTKQLMAGCVPRVTPAHKLTSTATLEVLAGTVVACADGRPADSHRLPAR